MNASQQSKNAQVSRQAAELGHTFREIKTPISVQCICVCGFSVRQTRAQNALARHTKLEADKRAHLQAVIDAKAAAVALNLSVGQKESR